MECRDWYSERGVIHVWCGVNYYFWADVINLHANTHNFTVSFSNMPIISKRETFTTSSCRLFFESLTEIAQSDQNESFRRLLWSLFLNNAKHHVTAMRKRLFDDFVFSLLVDYKISAQPAIEATGRTGSMGLTSDDVESLQNSSLQRRDGQSAWLAP